MSFTYAGPSVAATLTVGVFNEAIRLGEEKAADSTAAFDDAQAAAADTPVPTLLSQLAGVGWNPAALDETVLNDALAQLDQTFGDRSNLLDGLIEEIDSFMAEYFPGVNEGVEVARAALMQKLDQSGVADGRVLTRLLFLQARSVSSRDINEQEDDLIAEHAANGYPVPSGQLAWGMSQLRKKEIHTLADAEQDAMNKGATQEASSLERILRMLSTARATAIGAFSAYLARAAAARYDESLQGTEAQLMAQRQLAEAMADYAQARGRVAGFELRKLEGNFDLDARYLGKLDDITEKQRASFVEALLAHAKSLGIQTATAYNNARASTGVGGGEQIE